MNRAQKEEIVLGELEKVEQKNQREWIDVMDDILDKRYGKTNRNFDPNNFMTDLYPDDCVDERPPAQARKEPLRIEKSSPPPLRRPRAEIFNVKKLMEYEFKPLVWAVEGLLPEGCVLFAGRPKLGKSWFAYLLGLAISVGGRVFGTIRVEQGDVLYLALEDGKRRLQSRFKKLAQGKAPAPEALHLAVTWPRLDEGGLDDLEAWLSAHPRARLVIIDTLQRVRPQNRTNAGLYENDYNALAELADLARKFAVCILVVHHTRKADAEDAFDTVSGSTGLTGAVDATLVLKRSRNKGDAELHITGRDVEEASKALEFDKKTMVWKLLGDIEEVERRTEQTDILEYLSESELPMGPKQIAETLDKKEGSVRKILSRLAKEGRVRLVSYGKYSADQSSLS